MSTTDRTALPRLGALARWRAELASGGRKNTAAHFDKLQAAACMEATALDFEAQGDNAGARHFMDWAFLRLHGSHETPGTTEGRVLLRQLRGEVRIALQTQMRRGLDARIAAGRDRAMEYTR